MTSQTSKPKRRVPWILLALSIALIAVAASLVAYLQSNSFRERVRRELIAKLEEATGGKVELKNLTWSFSQLRFTADDLTIHGLEAANDVPYAHVDHAQVSVKIISVLRQELALRDVQIQHPVVHLIVYADGSTNQPRPKVGLGSGKNSGELFALRMDKLLVSDGLLLFNDKRLPFDVSANSVDAGLFYRAGTHPSYDGRIQAGRVELSHPGTVVISQAETRFTVRNNKIEVSSLRWSSGRSNVEASGEISGFANPRVDAKYSATLELSRIAAILGVRELRDGLAGVTGSIRYISTDDFFSSGKLTLKDGAYSAPGLRLDAVDAVSDYTVDVDRITLSKINGHGLGGSFSGTATLAHWANLPPKTGVSAGSRKLIPAKPQEGSIELKVSGIQLAQGLRAILPSTNPVNRLRLASICDGKVTVRWKGSPLYADTVLDLQAQAPASTSFSELPLTGSIQATYHGSSGRIDVAGVNLASRETRLSAAGAIGARSQMRVSLNTSDLSELTPVMQALGSSEGPLPAILHGQASFNGTLSGTLDAPNLSGHLQATDFDTLLPSLNVRFGNQPPNTPSPQAAAMHRLHWDSLTADVAYSPTSASARNVVLKRGKAQITGSETAGLINGQLEPESPLEVRMALRNTDLADLQALFGVDYPITGSFTGHLTLDGTKENLNATGHMQLADGSIYGEPYRSFSADLLLQGNNASLHNILFRQNGGSVVGESNYNFTTQAFAFNVSGSNFDLAHISRLQNGKLSWGGRAEFSATGSGTLAQPMVNAKFSIAGLTLNGENAGDVVATAVTQGSNLHLEAHTNTQLASANIVGDVSMQGDLPAQLHFDLARMDLDPLLRAYLPGKITGHSLVSGKFVLNGPLKRPHDIAVSADVDQFSLEVQNVKLQNAGPFRFSLSREVISIEQLHIVGTDTEIIGTGKVELTGAQKLDLHGNGHINMALLQNFNSNVSSTGQMTFTVNATGTVNQPNFAGNVQIANGSVAFVDLPNGLSEINGTLSFDLNRLRVQKLTAKSGGGDLVLGGYITYANGLFFDLNATGRDIRLRYPEGVSSQATADVRLVGTLQNSLLSGDVTITKFGLTPQFDLAGYVQRAKQPPTPPSPNSVVDNVRLDVHIVSTPELRVETSLARLSGDVDMHLRGTAARPSILGRMSIAEGDITFNGTTYHLERGDIVFANPVRIEPVVNVEASARVRDYDITLGFHGTPEKLNVTYRSEPPLPSADIIALLAFGRTRQESEIQAEQGSQAASQQSFAQTASNAILGEALNSAVSSRVQKLFGISRIKIDPNLGGTEDNPNARLTVEQQISKDVTVTYLTNLGQYAEEVLQVEYNINKNVSLVAVRDYTGVLAIDLRIRQRKR